MFNLNTTEVTVDVNKALDFEIVNTLLDMVNPLEPLDTVVHDEPPFVLYCQLLYVKFCNLGVKVIVSGVNVVPPSVDLKITFDAKMSTDFALVPLVPGCPSSPFCPSFTFVQLNDFVNDLPSTVIGILKEPLSANVDTFAFALIVIRTPLLASVNPVTLGNVPIVGVIGVEPLYAITSVVTTCSAVTPKWLATKV